MPTKHTIAQGDSVIKLSEELGFFAKTIWNHGENDALRRDRADMNVLMPGDVLTIPDKKPKQVDKPSDKKHRFRRKGVPAKFRLQVFDVEEPRANQDYQLSVDGKLLKGTTDASGTLEEFIPTGAQEGELTIGPDEYTVKLRFGHLDPITENHGVQKRLTNLGYDCGEPDGKLNPQTKAAIRAFQKRFVMKESGELDDATRKKIDEVHDAPSDFPEDGDE